MELIFQSDFLRVFKRTDNNILIETPNRECAIAISADRYVSFDQEKRGLMAFGNIFAADRACGVAFFRGIKE